MSFNEDLLAGDKKRADCSCGGIYRRLYVSTNKRDSMKRTWLATIYRMCDNCGKIIETETKNKPKSIVRIKNNYPYIRRLLR